MPLQTENLLGSSPLRMQAGGTIVKNRLVKFSAEGTVVACALITDNPIGVAKNGASTGDEVVIQTINGTVASITAGAAISAGAEVMPQNAGAGKVATSAGTTAVSCGIALAEATADGQEIPVLLRFAAKGPANA